jgi:hypothetical protein
MIRHIWLAIILCSVFPVSNGVAQNGKSAATPATESAVTEAIADEIYDWSCQKYIEFVGKDIGQDRRQLRVYIDPTIENGRGAVIYKFMPIGEVYRLYFLLQNGSVYLDDDPWLGFGPERPPIRRSTWMTTSFAGSSTTG